MKNLTGILLATAVSALFTTAVVASSHNNGEANKTVKCSGGNACKGQSVCKSAHSACKGQNACKGQGWIMTSDEKECVAKGGKVDKS